MRYPVTVKVPEGADLGDHPQEKPHQQQPREQVRLHSVPELGLTDDVSDDNAPDDDLEDEDMRDTGEDLEVPERLRGMRLPGDDEPAAERLDTEESRAVLAGQIAIWHRQGKTEFAYEDIVDAGVLDRTGRSRTWPYAELDLLVEKGKLRRLPGFPHKWRILDAA